MKLSYRKAVKSDRKCYSPRKRILQSGTFNAASMPCKLSAPQQIDVSMNDAFLDSTDLLEVVSASASRQGIMAKVMVQPKHIDVLEYDELDELPRREAMRPRGQYEHSLGSLKVGPLKSVLDKYVGETMDVVEKALHKLMRGKSKHYRMLLGWEIDRLLHREVALENNRVYNRLYASFITGQKHPEVMEGYYVHPITGTLAKVKKHKPEPKTNDE